MEILQSTLSERIDLEIIRYRSEPSAVLNYKKCKHVTKLAEAKLFQVLFLVKLVGKYLSVPVTSVPSERAFSRAGHIVNDRRACLLP